MTPGPVEQDGSLVALPQQARGDERIDDADGALKGDGVKSDERFLARIGLHIGEYFFFIVHEEVTGFVQFFFDFRHW